MPVRAPPSSSRWLCLGSVGPEGPDGGHGEPPHDRDDQAQRVVHVVGAQREPGPQSSPQATTAIAATIQLLFLGKTRSI